MSMSKTFFTHLISNQDRKLFSANLNSDGTILLGLKSAGIFRHAPETKLASRGSLGDSQDDNSSVMHQHCSIHPSAKSDYCLTTIKFTATLNGIENPLHVYGTYRDLSKGYFAPVFCHVVSDRTSAKYGLKLKEQKTAKPVGAYDPAKQTFVYSVFVTRRKPKLSKLRHRLFRTTIHKVGEFYVLVCSTSLNVPSRGEGQLLHFGNEKKYIESYAEKELESQKGRISPAEFNKRVMSGYSEVLRGYLELISKIDGEDWNWLMNLPVKKLLVCPPPKLKVSVNNP